MRKLFFVLTCFILSLFSAASLHAGIIIDIQGGPVFTGYNDVRVPGDDGTKFSLSDDLTADTAWSARFEAGYEFGERHYAGFMATPLRVSSSGSTGRDINFNGTTFPAGQDLKARFRFDSYRLTYRYDFYRGEVFNMGAGLTAKIRDASIRLEGNGTSSEKKNTGFVPIINFAVEAALPADFFVFLGGDMLAAPQGRAEDIAILAGYRINRTFRIKAGYRMLEGGADNDEVYTFSMFHYAVIGFDARF